MIQNNQVEFILEKYKDQIPKLKQYAHMIYEQNQLMNITGFKTEKEIFEQGVLCSLLVFEEASRFQNITFENKEILDIGAGAGFPSVPLLIALNNKFHLTIIESITKRCEFLSKIKNTFNLNITVINERAENVKNANEKFDIITARALATSTIIYLISNHMLKRKGLWILPKGKNYQLEVDEFKDKFTLEKNFITSFNYFDQIQNDNSALIIISKEKPTPRGWPWNWSKIKNY
ncbi:16S rRNA (guanine(527)-N(7))-methyltransferase RsmG [Mycoplasmopsis felifaucium]|uniref:16S rRNA (guanine(527)-N(7))-methyltransferase RsmG n=1 Tax=Mycoplasmopsis felifaucium TaxID=35768 RepID=UPI000AEB1E5C|nr:16S rRNA (guanine(527)-N(7))-methyltransferase RsmG [Mycoplasmopsis felifaucium]